LLQNRADYGTPSLITAPLSPSQRIDLENRLTVITYQFNHDFSVREPGTDGYVITADTLFGVGIVMVLMMMMILAGSSVSSEISSGTIKSLIIAPVMRWKILAAKILSLLTTSVLVVIVLYVCGMISLGIFYGFQGNTPYVYIHNGTAESIPMYLYQLLRLLVKFIDVIVYIVFAVMVSVLTRSTAAAVGISLGAFFGGTAAASAMQSLPENPLLKFIPFINLDLEKRIFPFRDLLLSDTVWTANRVMEPAGIVFRTARNSFLIILCGCFPVLHGLYRNGFLQQKGYITGFVSSSIYFSKTYSYDIILEMY